PRVWLLHVDLDVMIEKCGHSDAYYPYCTAVVTSVPASAVLGGVEVLPFPPQERALRFLSEHSPTVPTRVPRSCDRSGPSRLSSHSARLTAASLPFGSSSSLSSSFILFSSQ